MSDEQAIKGKGRGWRGDSEGHSRAGKTGGQKVSADKEHMAAIGRKGGRKLSEDREHMAAIGRKGGTTASQDRTRMSEIGKKGGHPSKRKPKKPTTGAALVEALLQIEGPSVYARFPEDASVIARRLREEAEKRDWESA